MVIVLQASATNDSAKLNFGLQIQAWTLVFETSHENVTLYNIWEVLVFRHVQRWHGMILDLVDEEKLREQFAD